MQGSGGRPLSGKIMARSFVNWKTWGDTISFDITGISDEKTAVKVTSRPTASSTIVDYGKNLENVKTIVSFLEKSKRAGSKAGK
jgi:hypothetical protein